MRLMDHLVQHDTFDALAYNGLHLNGRIFNSLKQLASSPHFSI